MNLINEIGSDVARALTISKQEGKTLDVSRAREIIAAIWHASDHARMALTDKADGPEPDLQAAAASH